MMDDFWPITGHFRENMFLFAALQRQMHIHIPSAKERPIQQWNLGGKVALPALATTANMAKQPKKSKTDVSR